jgi:hypothetical protein
MLPLALALALQSQDLLEAALSAEKARVSDQGTGMEFRFELKDWIFIDCDTRLCEIRNFADGRGTSLGTRAADEDNSSALVAGLSGSNNWRTVQLFAKARAGSGPVSAEGFLAVWVAEKLEEGEVRARPEKGAKFMVGPYEFVVDSVKENRGVTEMVTLMVSRQEIPERYVEEMRPWDGDTKLSSSGNSQVVKEERDRNVVWVHTRKWLFLKPPADLKFKYKVFVQPVRRRIPFKITAELTE